MNGALPASSSDSFLTAPVRCSSAKRLFVQIFETAEGGFGVNGQVFVPRSR
jgi:hypothetical protein